MLARVDMRQYRQNPVLMRVDGLFRKQFDDALEANNPEAHYLEGLRLQAYMEWGPSSMCINPQHI
ncbi:unnamed protein product [Arabidopsis thaliana]|uniref:(thale cress) hypothetical protein n=1 Tax=Arabidopsis thaliana TaxID=3702 RepID=A0A7G2E0A1_ARATH|nr:unnamed protein product [Arabidopsis thaliana]